MHCFRKCLRWWSKRAVVDIKPFFFHHCFAAVWSEEFYRWLFHAVSLYTICSLNILWALPRVIICVHRLVPLLQHRLGLHLWTQARGDQQQPSHYEEESSRPAAEQGISKLPSWHHFRYFLIKEMHHSEMGHVGHRDQTQHPRNHPQNPSYDGESPLGSIFTAVHQVKSRYSHHDSQQAHSEASTHEDASQLEIAGQAQQTVIRSTLHATNVLDYAGLPQAQLVALYGQQCSGHGQPLW